MNTKKLTMLLSCLSLIQTETALAEVVLPLKFDTGNAAPYGFPTTIISIQGQTFPIIVDTGGKKWGVMLREQAIHKLHVQFTGKTICSQTTEGRICLKEIIIPEIQIGDYLVKNVHGTYLPKWWGHVENFKETEASRNGMLGFEVLSQFNFLIDSQQGRIIFTKKDEKLTGYDIKNWISLPFKGHLQTQLNLNDKPIIFSWDTGAVPSIIKQSKVAISALCPKDSPFKGRVNCFYTTPTSLTTMNGKNLPATWFMISPIPSFAPFDGLIGANFYQQNVVYFAMGEKRIYIKPA